MTFEEYLKGKKIDSEAFRQHEPAVWVEWKLELEQMHPSSFTAQKLYLINPVRRKYPAKVEVSEPVKAASTSEPTKENVSAASPVAAKPKPVFKPKPKIG
jgi:hypothetical protein